MSIITRFIGNNNSSLCDAYDEWLRNYKNRCHTNQMRQIKKALCVDTFEYQQNLCEYNFSTHGNRQHSQHSCHISDTFLFPGHFSSTTWIMSIYYPKLNHSPSLIKPCNYSMKWWNANEPPRLPVILILVRISGSLLERCCFSFLFFCCCYCCVETNNRNYDLFLIWRNSFFQITMTLRRVNFNNSQ